jgi:hypothetical protein
MTRVFQDKYGPNHGTCLQAAVASVLSLPLHAVPDIAHVDPEIWQAFLLRMNLVELTLPASARPDCYYIASGASEKTGREHACVYRAGKLVHDPHPGRKGLSRIDSIYVLVPMELDYSEEAA